MSEATIQKESSEKKEITKDKPYGLFPAGISSFNDIERIFDDYFHRNWLNSLNIGHSKFEDLWGTYEMREPKMDLIDKENRVVVRAELPGVDKDDLDVSVNDNILTIKATSKKEHEKEEAAYYSKEIKSGSFSRSVSLPANTDSSKISASFNNGLLELTIPKTSNSKKVNIKIS